MAKRIKIRKVSAWTLQVTLVLAVLFAVVSFRSEKEFKILRMTTEQYIACERAAKQLQDGSDYLTEQVRLYAITRESKYMNLYFEEAGTHRREEALASLEQYFDGTEMFDSLEEALECSKDLMDTEYYSMRLVSDAMSVPEDTQLQEIKNVQLSEEGSRLGKDGKLIKVGNLVCNNSYQDVRTRITSDVSKCMNGFIEQTRQKQARSTSIFTDMYLKLEIHYLPLLLIDVDIFKSVNDTYGHAAGDAILKKVVGCLKPAFRSIDYVCRIGGDEFVIRLNNATEQDTKECMQRVKEALAAADKKTDIPISAAMGYAWSDAPDKDTEKLLQNADAQMYENKQMMKKGKIL